VKAGTGEGAGFGAWAVAGAGLGPRVEAGAVARAGAKEGAGVGVGAWIGAGLEARAALPAASYTQEVPQEVAASRGASTVDWLFAPALPRDSARSGGALQPLDASKTTEKQYGTIPRSRNRPKSL